MNVKTYSSVHTMNREKTPRRRESAKANERLAAINVYVQCIIGFSLYLYDHVSTPGWISLLAAIPFLITVYFLGRFLYTGAEPGQNAVSSVAGKTGGRIVFFSFFMIHMLDALTVFFALIAVIQDVMPDLSVVLSALAVCLFCAYALFSGGENAVPRLARFLPNLILLLFLCCLLFAVPYGKAAHFFPALGYGAVSIGKGTLWICGAFSSAAWPILLPVKPGEPSIPASYGAKAFFRCVIPLLAAVMTYCVSVWLMPVYALARPESMGWRMLLVTHMTPSVPAWSMEVLGLFLLLLFSLCASVKQAAAFFSASAGNEKKDFPVASLLLLLLFPSCLIEQPLLQRFLIRIYPWRGYTALGLLTLMCFIRLTRRGKTRKQEAESP